MRSLSRNVWPSIAVIVFCLSAVADADVVSGTALDWMSDDEMLRIGDNDHHVNAFWTDAAFMPDERSGYFYGSMLTSDSDVALAAGVTDINQIIDAAVFSYTDRDVGPALDAGTSPDGVGDFIVYRNVNTGHYGALRIDEIRQGSGSLVMDATWWFQTDGSASFVPEPGSLTLLTLAALAGLRRR